MRIDVLIAVFHVSVIVACDRNVEVITCDECGEEGAVYEIDGSDYCEECAKKYIQDCFDDLTLSEKAKMLDINFSEIE